jgi:hypothetical protein
MAIMILSSFSLIPMVYPPVILEIFFIPCAAFCPMNKSTIVPTMGLSVYVIENTVLSWENWVQTDTPESVTYCNKNGCF